MKRFVFEYKMRSATADLFFCVYLIEDMCSWTLYAMLGLGLTILHTNVVILISTEY